MHHPTDRIAHTTAFVTPVVEHWLEREIAQWVHPMKDRSDDPPHHERTLYLWATSRSPHIQIIKMTKNQLYDQQNEKNIDRNNVPQWLIELPGNHQNREWHTTHIYGASACCTCTQWNVFRWVDKHGLLSLRLAARVILYAPSYRQDITYHGLWYSSRGALVGTFLNVLY